MADWRDGAQYAPTTRPYGFATPRAAALDDPEQTIDLAAGQPPVAPDAFHPAAAPVPPLEALVPRPERAPRNPQQPFLGSGSASGTDQGAWGAAHSSGRPGAPGSGFDPHAPIVTESSMASARPAGGGFAPPQGGPVALPPPAGAPVASMPAPPAPGPNATGPTPVGPGAWAPPTGPQSASAVARQVISAMGVPLVLTLVATVVIAPVSFVLLMISAVLAARAKVAAPLLTKIVGVAGTLALVLSLFNMFDLDAWQAICRWSQILGAIALLVSAGVVWSKLTGRQGPPGR